MLNGSLYIGRKIGKHVNNNSLLFLPEGYISLEEFSDACNLIKEHMPNPITQDQLVDICKLMDINKDGLVDLNEFLETFRMVDPEQAGQKLKLEDVNSEPNFARAEVKLKEVNSDAHFTKAEVTTVTENGTKKSPTSGSPQYLSPKMNGAPVTPNSVSPTKSINPPSPTSPTHKNVLPKSPVLSSRRVD